MTRSGKQFEDGKQWVYSCTCDLEKSRFFNSLHAKLDCTFTSFCEDYLYCIHVNAVLELVTDFDAVHCLSPDLDFAGTMITHCHLIVT